jgi:uncharacterized RDD family membrane protein YckC
MFGVLAFLGCLETWRNSSVGSAGALREAESRPSEERPRALASRWLRAVAATYDTILLMLACALPASMLGYWEREDRTQMDILVATIIVWCAFLILNGYLLAKNGQTMGKVVTNIRIVAAETGELVPFWRLLGLRYVLPALASLLPVAGPFFPLVDVVCIFGRDRRCLHDWVAGTKVVVVRAD